MLEKIKDIKLFLILFVCSGFLNCSAITLTQREINNSTNNEATAKEQRIKETFCTGQVKKIIFDIEEDLPGGNKQRSQQLLLEIISGADKGKIRTTTNIIPDNPAFAIIGKIGRKYLINKIENIETGAEEYFIADYYRENLVWILIFAFLAVIVFVGGIKGIRAIVSLFVTILLVVYLLIPLLERGINPVVSAVFISLLATAVTMLFVAGINKKSLASILGTGIGVTISGIIAYVVIKAAPLSGLASSEAMILWGNQFYEINFKGLLASGMIIASLGAVMDVAISTASTIQEIKSANKSYSFRKLFTSGMNVGKDIMGTMANTLILVYTGMALPLLLLISHEPNPAKFLNLELVVSEITAAISGSIGLIFTIPATALIMSALKDRDK